jgi:Trk K+ transport system NAD-binding subunit
MAEELTARYGLAVTAIVPGAANTYAARMSDMPGVRVLEKHELGAAALLDAGVTTADGLAILHEDDIGNFHTALRAQELAPDIRIVMAIFNSGLGDRISSFLTDCAVLSEAQMAAPSLVAAALGEPAPSHVRMASRTMYVTRRGQVGADQIICGLAVSIDADAPNLLPPEDAADGLVLAVADGTPRDPMSRRPRRLTARLRFLGQFRPSRIATVFLTLTAVLGAGFALLFAAANFSWVNSLYLTLLDGAGAAVTDPSLPAAEKLAQVLVTFDGMAFLPVVTAVIVGARLPRSPDRDQAPLAGHVIVAGLGTVGARVVGLLRDLGIDVVAVDKSPDAAGLPLARRLGARIVIGESHRDETLRTAGIATCQALVSVADSDIANLETALNARALAASPRIILRLNDDDLAARVQGLVDNVVSRSTSDLAAPAFAAAVLDHRVLRTIAVGRHVLLLAEVAADDSTGLAGVPIAAVHQPGRLRVIALRLAGSAAVDWSPDPAYVIRAGDRVVVLASRAGLSELLRRDGKPRSDRVPGTRLQD